MTKEELAKLCNVSMKTLYNWEKEKPGLISLINKGLAFEEMIKSSKDQIDKLEEIEKNASDGKLKLK